MPHYHFTRQSKSHPNSNIIYDCLQTVFDTRVVAVLSVYFARIRLGWRLRSGALVMYVYTTIDYVTTPYEPPFVIESVIARFRNLSNIIKFTQLTTGLYDSSNASVIIQRIRKHISKVQGWHNISPYANENIL